MNANPAASIKNAAVNNSCNGNANNLIMIDAPDRVWVFNCWHHFPTPAYSLAKALFLASAASDCAV
jgi:hypothetical protein